MRQNPMWNMRHSDQWWCLPSNERWWLALYHACLSTEIGKEPNGVIHASLSMLNRSSIQICSVTCHCHQHFFSGYHHQSSFWMLPICFTRYNSGVKTYEIDCTHHKASLSHQHKRMLYHFTSASNGNRHITWNRKQRWEDYVSYLSGHGLQCCCVPRNWDWNQ